MTDPESGSHYETRRWWFARSVRSTEPLPAHLLDLAGLVVTVVVAAVLMAIEVAGAAEVGLGLTLGGLLLTLAAVEVIGVSRVDRRIRLVRGEPPERRWLLAGVVPDEPTNARTFDREGAPIRGITRIGVSLTRCSRHPNCLSGEWAPARN